MKKVFIFLNCILLLMMVGSKFSSAYACNATTDVTPNPPDSYDRSDGTHVTCVTLSCSGGSCTATFNAETRQGPNWNFVLIDLSTSAVQQANFSSSASGPISLTQGHTYWVKVADNWGHGIYGYGVPYKQFVADNPAPPPTTPPPPPPTTSPPPPPPAVTPPPPVGNHDAADCSQGIWGWACQQGYYSSTNRVDVYIDGPYGTGTYIGSANAGINRSDLTAAGVCGGNPNHGFDLTPSQMTGLKMPHDGQSHAYYAYAINASGNNQNPLLSNTPKSTTCAQDPVSLTLVLGLPGIGYNGPTAVTPKHLTRSVTVQLYDASVTDPSGPGTSPLASGKGTVTFDSGSDSNAGYFVGTISNIPLPTTPPANNQYKILVQVPQYLYQLAMVNPPPSDSSQANIFTLTSGQSVTTAPFSLLPGDVYTANGGLNHLNLNDYNQILTCFNSASDPTCTKTPDGLLFTDLDDNGVVDIVDMNLWLRSLSQLIQAQAPGCSTGDCQGD